MCNEQPLSNQLQTNQHTTPQQTIKSFDDKPNSALHLRRTGLRGYTHNYKKKGTMQFSTNCAALLVVAAAAALASEAAPEIFHRHLHGVQAETLLMPRQNSLLTFSGALGGIKADAVCLGIGSFPTLERERGELTFFAFMASFRSQSLATRNGRFLSRATPLRTLPLLQAGPAIIKRIVVRRWPTATRTLGSR